VSKISAIPTPKNQPISETPAESMPQLTGYTVGSAMIALDAAREGDWEEVKEELNEAVDLSVDPRSKAMFSEMLDKLANDQTDAVVADLEQLIAAFTGPSPELGKIQGAIKDAQAGEWDEVQEELEEAQKLTPDARLQAGLAEALDDIAKNRTDEVVSDLEKLLGGKGIADPALPMLQQALHYASDGSWKKVTEQLNEAVKITTDARHQAAIIEMLDDLNKGKTDEVVSDLQEVLGE
jgi:cellobiose-specific phosphotransferase system component IIA